MKRIMHEELDFLALGATLLGSGGGGDPSYDLLMAKRQMEDSSPIPLYDVEEIEDDALVVPIAMMGAPLVGTEKIPNGLEFSRILKKIEVYFGKPITYLMPAEIGGGNAFAPIVTSASLGLKVVNADLLGRAFPEIQMNVGYLHGLNPSPAFLCNSLGDVITIEETDTFKMEKICREKTVSMGSSAAIALYIMTGKIAKQIVIRGSITQAISLGRSLRCEQFRPDKTIVEGMIVDIDQKISEGFLRGEVVIQQADQTQYHIAYQNEYLAVLKHGKPLACTPDIIAIIEKETSYPLTSESLRYGQRVEVAILNGPEIWKTRKGLQIVGPKYFNYSFDYKEVVDEI